MERPVSVSRKRMSVELFTDMLRVTGNILTYHVYVRDELNDARQSLLIFTDIRTEQLSRLDLPPFNGRETWLSKDQVLLAMPHQVKGVTSTLTQRAIHARLGKNEHRILLDIPPFRVIGTWYFAGRFQIEDALQRDMPPFATVSDAEVTWLPDPSISFITDEVIFNTSRVKMLCARFD